MPLSRGTTRAAFTAFAMHGQLRAVLFDWRALEASSADYQGLPLLSRQLFRTLKLCIGGAGGQLLRCTGSIPADVG